MDRLVRGPTGPRFSKFSWSWFGTVRDLEICLGPGPIPGLEIFRGPGPVRSQNFLNIPGPGPSG